MLNATAYNCSQPLPTASYQFQLLSNCLPTAPNYSQPLSTAYNHYKKIAKLWRKLWRKNIEIVTDPSQFVTEIVTEKIPSQFFVTDNLWRTYSVTISLWRKLWRTFSVTIRNCDGNCDGMFVTISGGGIWHGVVFVTEWIISVTILWRTFTIPSQFVTEFRHNLVLWRNSVTNSVTVLWVRRKKLFKTLTVFRLNAIVQCNKNWLNYHNRCIERRSNNKIHSN